MGKHLKRKKAGDYFQNYLNQIGRSYDIDEKDYLTGFSEISLIPGELSLHCKFDLAPNAFYEIGVKPSLSFTLHRLLFYWYSTFQSRY